MSKYVSKFVARLGKDAKKFQNIKKKFQAFPVNEKGHKEIVYTDKSRSYVKCNLINEKDNIQKIVSQSFLIEENWIQNEKGCENQYYYSRNALRSFILLNETELGVLTCDINKLELLITNALQRYPTIYNTGLNPQIIRNFFKVLENKNPNGRKLFFWIEKLYFSNEFKYFDKFNPTQSILSQILYNYIKNSNKKVINNVHIADILEKFNNFEIHGTTFIPYLIDTGINIENSIYSRHYFQPLLIERLYRNFLNYSLKSFFYFGIKHVFSSYIIDHLNIQIDGLLYIIKRLEKDIKFMNINIKKYNFYQKYCSSIALRYKFCNNGFI